MICVRNSILSLLLVELGLLRPKCCQFHLLFVQSLRMILKEFRLPGEAQQIDRILEKFSARVYATNPDLGFEK